MVRKIIVQCKANSDKDFIFDVFSNKGFVSNANSYFKTDQAADICCAEIDNEDQANPIDNDK
ncbi:hypothetical protein [Carboxylicivirga marina]|uniref:Uncharacterized protein n=1 Tax=Carboxylicivirga marina TaxID=2800988 RepID=A0ABS1HKH1_9BACT|nr:hypothetical protein [Carboxylicivirga marina]MBK3518178.1 hypothetical protein [Carboxylicivirga marina]